MIAMDTTATTIDKAPDALEELHRDCFACGICNHSGMNLHFDVGPDGVATVVWLPDPITDNMALYVPGYPSSSDAPTRAESKRRITFTSKPESFLSTRSSAGRIWPPRRRSGWTTVAALRSLTPQHMGFCHCTGATAIHRL